MVEGAKGGGTDKLIQLSESFTLVPLRLIQTQTRQAKKQTKQKNKQKKRSKEPFIFDFRHHL